MIAGGIGNLPQELLIVNLTSDQSGMTKNFSKSFSNVSSDIVRSYNAAVRKARALNNAAANKGSSQPQAQPAQNQQPVNNVGGENPNGRQEQNNPANAG